MTLLCDVIMVSGLPPEFKLSPQTHDLRTGCPPEQLVLGPRVPLRQLVLGPCVRSNA